MPCPINKIDSNVTALAYAEEECLKTLPVTPIWNELEPNSFADFGGEVSTVARNPINPSRQRKKGTVVDLDASGGFNTDVTVSNMKKLLQGFFFANAREKTSTIPINGTAIPITAVDGTAETYAAASGLTFLEGALIMASGFAEAANNGLKRLVTATSTLLTVAEDVVDEAAPSSSAKLEAVGFQFPSGDLKIEASASSIFLTSVLTDFTTLGLNVGEWIFIGGDSAGTLFANNAPGYARVKAIDTNILDLDDTTWTPVTETGGSLTVQMFFGTVLRNEKDASLIVRRSYQLERQLGSDDVGTQSEYLLGAIPNEFTLNLPQADKLNADLTFVGMDVEPRTGTEGIKSGTRVALVSEEPINTSSDIYRLKMSVVDPSGVLNPDALFGYVTEANIAINNNVTPNKAVGVLGAFDATAGDFDISGTATAYFADVTAVQAVRNNADVSLNVITALNNAGVIFDIPLLGLGGGRVNVEKDAPITLPLETMGAECDAGYTLLSNFFTYLPSVGMPA